MKEKLIVMLTHHDVTVKNAKETFEACKDLPVQNWGFKDVGLEPEDMKELCQLMKFSGKTTFLEVVTYSELECMRGAQLAVECGFDYLAGTIFYDSVLDYIKQHDVKYCPFVGRVSGSPSVLKGTVEFCVNQAEVYAKKGVYGIDLLGYRYAEGDPEVFSQEIAVRCQLPVIMAGSIDSQERIEVVRKMNPWTFTMGSALFDKKFVKDGTFRENLEKVVSLL
ncbi:hypothetical protein GKG47_08310 [Lactonifactor sp. BIOML-A3]|uniref:hypothetical protein n=1 Tax=Lactonifactor TaxID=420345 RepID=UPI0012AF6B43|nr:MULTISPECIES: hypothetical protein [Lactonifactor]MCB5713842.1 hypothetical protein [Lactonifactor longoviformis]MCB5717864.1 hypothetical protein [Lactonifactor longoviformis]MSA01613.1 hypothetical protein [Lactonifactor sp. BIOML-A5]MSA07831.1 hypothetical protein [Lactonifactor sp. BIOML-A4]MSA12448.1 hypothetical protein [Lactonifactor sp. BIOML-A3]